MPFLTDRMPPNPVSVVDACNRAFRESRLLRHTHTRKNPPESSTRTAPRQHARGTNQALAPTFWSPFIPNDIGIALHAERAKPILVALSMNLKDKSVAATRLTATMNHHSHPVIGASSGSSALLDITPRSSPKVLMAQTPNPLSAANEPHHPFASPSVKYRLAPSARRLPGQHQPSCHTPPAPRLNAAHTGAIQKRP